MGFQAFYCQGPPNITIYNYIYTNIPLWVTHFLKYKAKDKGRKELLYWKIQHKQCFLDLACKVAHWPQDHPIVVRVCDKHLTLRTHSVDNDAIRDRAQVCQLFIQGRKGESFLQSLLTWSFCPVSLRQSFVMKWKDGFSHNLFIISISVFLHCTRACCYGNSVQATAQ